VEFPILLLIVAASLTLCFNLWPSIRNRNSKDLKDQGKRPRFQERLHVYIPSAANTFGILTISFISGAIVPFILGIAAYLLLAGLVFVDFIQS